MAPPDASSTAPLPIPEFSVLELAPPERDSARLSAVASALGGGTVLELPFLRSLDESELLAACRTQLRVDRLVPGETICLQGEEADSAYVILSGTVSCHIRKDLQQMDVGLAYAALVKQFSDDAGAKAAAQDRMETKRRTSMFRETGASPQAFGDRRRSSVAGAAAVAALVNKVPVESPSFLRRPGGGYNISGGGSVIRYLLVPGLESLTNNPHPLSGWRKAAEAVLTNTTSATTVRSKASAVLGTSVAVLGVGDILGESSLLNSATMPRRGASAVCNSPVALLVCPRAAIAESSGADREQKMLEWMKQTPALVGCSNASLLQLIRNSKQRSYAMGDLLHNEGSSATSLGLIYSGEVSLCAAADAHAGSAVVASPRDAPAHTPRELPLRKLGPGQVITCTPSGSGLQDGCAFPTSSRVTSAHAQVVLLECRFTCLVLSKQDNGRALNELVSHLNNETARIAALRDAQRLRWSDGGELASSRLHRQASGTHVPDAASVDGKSSPRQEAAAPTGFLRMVSLSRHPRGHRSSTRLAEKPFKQYVASDPLVTASSRYADPENPTGKRKDFRMSIGAASPTRDGGVEDEPPTPGAAPLRRPTRPPSTLSRPVSARNHATASARSRPNSARVSRPASARQVNEEAKLERSTANPPLRAAEAPAWQKAAGSAIPGGRPSTGGGLRPGIFFDQDGGGDSAKLALALTPRQLRLRPQSAAAHGPVQHRQKDWLSKTNTLNKRVSTPRNSVVESQGGDRPRTAQTPIGPTQAEEIAARSSSPGFSVRISGDRVTDRDPTASRRRMRPRSRDGIDVNAAADPSLAGSWKPSRIEYQHVARMWAARGERPPSQSSPREEARLTPGRGQSQRWEDSFIQQQQQLEAQRTPLAVSTLNPDMLRPVSAQLVSPCDGEEDLGLSTGKPVFSSVKRPPIWSAAVRSTFYEEAAVAGLLVGPMARAFGGGAGRASSAPGSARPRATSARAQLTRENESTSPLAARSPVPGMGSPKPSLTARRSVGYQRPPVIWTRPIVVDGSNIANVLAYQQAPLA